MPRILDWPPVWLALCLALGWGVGQAVPVPLPGGAGQQAGAVLVAAGLLLMGLAVVQMAWARTTVVPRRTPAALVTGGVFRLGRNPIYLGDALVLLGAILWWDALLALPLVPAFAAIITARFIRAEETALRAAFGPAFDRWAAGTARWIGPVRGGTRP